MFMECLRPSRSERPMPRSEEHTSELQSQSNLVCRLLLEKKKKNISNSSLQYLNCTIFAMVSKNCLSVHLSSLLNYLPEAPILQYSSLFCLIVVTGIATS